MVPRHRGPRILMKMLFLRYDEGLAPGSVEEKSSSANVVPFLLVHLEQQTIRHVSISRADSACGRGRSCDCWALFPKTFLFSPESWAVPMEVIVLSRDTSKASRKVNLRNAATRSQNRLNLSKRVLVVLHPQQGTCSPFFDANKQKLCSVPPSELHEVDRSPNAVTIWTMGAL